MEDYERWCLEINIFLSSSKKNDDVALSALLTFIGKDAKKTLYLKNISALVINRNKSTYLTGNYKDEMRHCKDSISALMCNV